MPLQFKNKKQKKTKKYILLQLYSLVIVSLFYKSDRRFNDAQTID